MDKDTALDAGNAGLNYLDSGTYLPGNFSLSYRIKYQLNGIKIAAKAALLRVAIFIVECGRMPSALRSGNAKNYVSGFLTRYKHATEFCTGGEKLLSTMKFQTRYPREVQLQLLRSILTENAQTQFGKVHRFGGIDTVKQFREQVAISQYETLEPYIQKHLKGERDILVPGAPCYYATTSGSTGRPKFVPVTRTMERQAHQGSARLWSYTLYKNEPRAYTGKIIVIVSPAVEGYTEAGVPYGSISGQYIKNLNDNIKSKYAIPYELYEIKDYETRYYCMLLLGMADEGVTMLSSTNPSTLSLLAEKGNQHRADLIEGIRSGKVSDKYRLDAEMRQLVESRIKPNPARADYLLACIEQDPEHMLRPMHYWKQLVVIACWTGGNSHVFLNRMQRWYGDVKIKDLGYLASEIRGSVPLGINSSEGVLTIDENFFEFLEEGANACNDNYLLVDQLKIGKRYRLFFTNRGGLYRYDINDIVEVKGFVNGTPTIDFVQKGKGVTSITGEKIYEQQVLDVIEKVSTRHDLKVAYYQMQARIELSRYDLFCEFEHDMVDDEKLSRFIQDVESLMKVINLEYRTKRDSLRLHPMQLHLLEKNSFEVFRKWRVANGVREAQIKNVPLSSDISLITPLTIIKSITIQS